MPGKLWGGTGELHMMGARTGMGLGNYYMGWPGQL